MVATLASAFTLPLLGQIVDRWSARTVTLIIMSTVMGIYCFAACTLMLHVSRKLKARALQSAGCSVTGTL